MNFNSNIHVEHTQRNFARLCHFREQEHLCDVVLEATYNENNENVLQIPAHKLVLAAEIPYFKIMFSTAFMEKNKTCIFIEEVDADILLAVVAYAYNQELVLPVERVIPLLVAADYFQILPLLKKCGEFLGKHLQPNNCLEIRAIAENCNCQNLYSSCTSYARSNFESVTSFDEFLSLSPSKFKDFISSDRVCVTEEELVYLAAIKWVYYDLQERTENFPEILSQVRLSFVSLDFLNQVVEQEQLVLTSEECLKYLKEAHTFKSSLEACSFHDYNPRLNPRRLPGIRDVFIAVGGVSNKIEQDGLMEEYDPENDKWTILGHLPEIRYGISACYYNGYIYVMGGSYNEINKISQELERYNLRENQWETMEPMKIPRKYHASCVLYGRIYVTGGLTTDVNPLSSTECYNPEFNVWIERSSMNFCHIEHEMTTINSYLFVLGSSIEPPFVNTAEFFDPSQNIWTIVNSMPDSRYRFGMASSAGIVYVVGGQVENKKVNSMLCYDLEKNQWNECAPFKFPRSCMGVVAHEDNLYLCGGCDDELLTSVERYSFTSNSWEVCASMNYATMFCNVVAT